MLKNLVTGIGRQRIEHLFSLNDYYQDVLEAKEYLNKLVKNKYVSIKRLTKDRYGRTVAEISIKGTNVQKLLVETNHSEIYQKYANQCEWTNHF